MFMWYTSIPDEGLVYVIHVHTWWGPCLCDTGPYLLKALFMWYRSIPDEVCRSSQWVEYDQMHHIPLVFFLYHGFIYFWPLNVLNWIFFCDFEKAYQIVKKHTTWSYDILVDTIWFIPNAISCVMLPNMIWRSIPVEGRVVILQGHTWWRPYWRYTGPCIRRTLMEWNRSLPDTVLAQTEQAHTW